MSELLKSILGLVNPVGAQREQINLLSLEKSQLVALVSEMQNHISELGSEIKTLQAKDKTNYEQIKELEKQLHFYTSSEYEKQQKRSIAQQQEVNQLNDGIIT